MFCGKESDVVKDEVKVDSEEVKNEDVAASIDKVLSNMYGKEGNSYTVKVLKDVQEKGEAGTGMSYDVDAAVKRMDTFFQFSEKHRLLDVGSGVGGPARRLIRKCGVNIMGLEFQGELHQAGVQLTNNSDVKDKMTHMNGDVLVSDIGKDYDGAYGILVFLHITDKEKLFERLSSSLKPGGKLYFDDFIIYQDKPLTDNEKSMLSTVVSCDRLCTAAEYKQILGEKGFKDIVIKDMTEPFLSFTKTRTTAWDDNKEANVKKYGKDVVDGYTEFVHTMVALFEGNLGGCNITATKSA